MNDIVSMCVVLVLHLRLFSDLGKITVVETFGWGSYPFLTGCVVASWPKTKGAKLTVRTKIEEKKKALITAWYT